MSSDDEGYTRMSDELPDPFRDARQQEGVLPIPAGDETIPMLLRHEEVRRAAKDWRTFSSDAPFRVPIPSEEHLRHDRQLPIETDPPDHTEYRELVEPLFLRAREPAYLERIEAIVTRLVEESLAHETNEVVEGFALPLQSRALTVLLNVPEAEADRWIGWGCMSSTAAMARRRPPHWTPISTPALIARRQPPAMIFSACSRR